MGFGGWSISRRRPASLPAARRARQIGNDGTVTSVSITEARLNNVGRAGGGAGRARRCLLFGRLSPPRRWARQPGGDHRVRRDRRRRRTADRAKGGTARRQLYWRSESAVH